MLCERGIRTFETATRFTLDLSAVPWLKLHTHLPVIVDPSHASGDRRLVEPLARAAAAVGADGIIVEVHQDPEEALCDGPQALYARDFAGLRRARRRPRGPDRPRACPDGAARFAPISAATVSAAPASSPPSGVVAADDRDRERDDRHEVHEQRGVRARRAGARPRSRHSTAASAPIDDHVDELPPDRADVAGRRRGVASRRAWRSR